MTIQVGHPHKCPTFFLCAFPGGSQRVNGSTSQRVNKSTSQQVNKSTGQDRSYKPDSADAAICKSPFLHFFAKYMRHLRHISIIISVRYNLTDQKNRPFGLQIDVSQFFIRNFSYLHMTIKLLLKPDI